MESVAIHDWTRVDAGTWHSFHGAWLAEFRRVLNTGALPDGFYADMEKPESGYVPDVVTLEEASSEIMADVPDEGGGSEGGGGGTAVAAAPPATALRLQSSNAEWYATRRRPLGIRHENGDRLVALIELVSPGNKHSAKHVAKFTTKVADALASRVHVSVIDLFPPRRPDGPGGLVGACADAAGFDSFDLPDAKPLCIGAFEATEPVQLYADPLAAGDALPDLPVFLRAGWYVNVPLASTYAAAWAGTPRRWRDVITGAAPPPR